MYHNVRSVLAVLLSVNLVLLPLFRAQAIATEDAVLEAEGLYRADKYLAAVSAAAEALKDKSLLAEERIRAERVIFMSAMKLGEREYAEDAATRLLRLAPDYQLEGPDVQHEMARVFERIRWELGRAFPIDEVEGAYNRGDYYDAMDKATGLLEGRQASEDEQIRAERVIFLSSMKVGERRYAERAVRRLVKLEPGHRLEGSDVSSEERELLEEVRAQVAGQLTLTGVPEDARVVVDGEKMETVPMDTWVLAGTRDIAITSPTYRDTSFAITIDPTERAVVDVGMEALAALPSEEEPERAEPRPIERLVLPEKRKGGIRSQWLLIGGGAALAAGAYLLFKSDDEEPSTGTISVTINWPSQP
jgi:hypothetical protein